MGSKDRERIRRSPRRTGAAPQTPDVTWTLTPAAGSTVNEGASEDFTLAFDRHGRAAEAMSIFIRSPIIDGNTKPFGAFAENTSTAVFNAAALKSPAGSVVRTVLGSEVRLDFTAEATSPVTITRNVLNNAVTGDSGNYALEIYNPSTGVISGGGIAQVAVVDTTTTPGNLTDILLSADTVYVDYVANVTVVPASGTVVGAISGVGTLSSWTLTNDAGGRFVKSGNNIVLTSVKADFEGDPQPAYNNSTVGTPFYNITVRGVGPSGEIVDKPFKIRPHWALTNPTGDATETITDVTTAAGFKTAVQLTTANRTVRVDENTNIAFENTSTQVINRINFTLLSHRRAILCKNWSVWTRGGYNHVYRGFCARAGADPNSEGNKASWTVNALPNTGTKMGDMLWIQGDMSWSWDELLRVIGNLGPYFRKIRFSKVFFHDALHYAGDDTGNHPYGPLIYARMMNVMIDECVFSGFPQRSPMWKKLKGIQMYNNVICYRGSSGGEGGIGFGSDSTGNPEINMEITADIRGNLLFPMMGALKARAIMFHRIGPGSYIHLPTSGNYQNHFFDMVPRNFAGDPVGLAHVYLDQYVTAEQRAANDFHMRSSISNIVQDRPFETDYVLMPTSTVQERTDLFNKVIYGVGARTYDGGQPYGAVADVGIANLLKMSKIGYTALKKLLDTGTATIQKGAFPFGGNPDAPRTVGGVTEPVMSNITPDVVAFDTGVPT